ncbi:MAG: hypothetical protein LDL35_11985 [Methanospirillum hungatei]|nr:hypothetical protein [Methanospirillum hungatei]
MGSDSDQSVLSPDIVIGSAIKRLYTILYEKIQSLFSNTYYACSDITGLKDKGTSHVLNPRFENSTHLIESRMREAIERENAYLTTPSSSNIQI